jgi:hypothetical protein
MPTPTNLPAGAFAKFLERLFVEVLRMRVQAGHHARNGIGDELFLIHGLDIVALDHAEHSCQLLQLFQWQRCQSTTCHRLQLNRGQRTCDGTTGTQPAILSFCPMSMNAFASKFIHLALR